MMDARRRKYILRQDRPGKIVPRTKLESAKKYIAEKALKASDSFPALMGDLFQEGPDDEQPADRNRILVSLMGNESRVLEVDTGDLAPIEDRVAKFLLPIDGQTRLELFSRRRFLEEAMAAKIDDICEVEQNKRKSKGIIKGVISSDENQPGLFFQVMLLGTKVERNKYVLATVDQMSFKVQKSKLETGKRVIVFVEDRPVAGTVKYIGKPKFSKDECVGIELDSDRGNCEGKLNNQRLFTCRRNHGYFTSPSAIILQEDYDGPQEDTSPYCIIEDEKDKERNHSRNDLTQMEHTMQPSRSGLIAEQALQMKQLSDRYLIGSKDRKGQLNTDPLTQKMPVSYAIESRSSVPMFFDDHFGEIKSSGILAAGREVSLPEREVRMLDGPSISSDNRNKIFDRDLIVHPTAPLAYGYSAYGRVISGRNDADVGDFGPRADQRLQVDSVVQVTINDVAHYGVICWLGYLDDGPQTDLVAGLELEEPSNFAGDGTFRGKRYFKCTPGRGFFAKFKNIRPDKRFTSVVAEKVSPANQDVEEVPGNFAPPNSLDDGTGGRMRGIQGHHNSCYLDATLFAMFAFSVAFDSLLYRKKRDGDIPEYEQVRNALKNAIVNPLRTKGFVNAASILRLRRWLDKVGNVQGFMNEEKDPEEFLMLLLKDVLKVDPFLKIRTNSGSVDASFFYQILCDREENNPVPTLQYLIEASFHTGLFYLEEVPSVFVVQLPRYGIQKMYKRIRLNRTLDISSVMTSASFKCLICEDAAKVCCKECCHSFGWEHPFVCFCQLCSNRVHQHSSRLEHKVSPLQVRNGSTPNKELTKLELFAVVCIKTSHYVAFTKLGDSDNEKWMFFDSMADRIGGENGHNVPEVVECPEIKDWFDKAPLNFAESDSKNTPEKVLRLFEDASLCLYRSTPLSMYR